MEAYIIAIILVSGFMFTTRYPVARFKQLRAKEWILYLHIFTWGLAFSTIALLFVQLIFALYVFWNFDYCRNISFREYWVGNVFRGPFSFFVFLWSILSVLFSWFVGYLSSLCPHFINEGIKLCAYENALKAKIYDSLTNGLLVQVTLSNRKVYVGVVLFFLDIKNPETKYIRFFPIMSGYRDPRKMLIHLSNDYSYWDIFKSYLNLPVNSLNNLSSNGFGSNLEKSLQARELFLEGMNRYTMVIPIESIITMTNFDINFYIKVNGNTSD